MSPRPRSASPSICAAGRSPPTGRGNPTWHDCWFAIKVPRGDYQVRLLLETADPQTIVDMAGDAERKPRLIGHKTVAMRAD